jgi:hypothetical protein
MSRSTVLIAGEELSSYGFPNGHPFGMDRYGVFIAEVRRSSSSFVISSSPRLVHQRTF